MTIVQLVVVGVCLAGVLAMTIMGAYWLGWRRAARAICREQMDDAVDRILTDADFEEDDEDGGIRVLT